MKHKCIFCGAELYLWDKSDLSDKDGCSLDCPECGDTMIVKNGVLYDMNEYLRRIYADMRLDVSAEQNFTKNYIEF